MAQLVRKCRMLPLSSSLLSALYHQHVHSAHFVAIKQLNSWTPGSCCGFAYALQLQVQPATAAAAPCNLVELPSETMATVNWFPLSSERYRIPQLVMLLLLLQLEQLAIAGQGPWVMTMTVAVAMSVAVAVWLLLFANCWKNLKLSLPGQIY